MKTLKPILSSLFAVIYCMVFSFNASLFAQPIANGDAVATCYSGSNPNGYVTGILKVQPFQTAPINSNWSSASVPALAMSHGPLGNEWTSAKLGEVFGIALDGSGNIYVAATSIYPLGAKVWGANGVPSIYKINGTSGAISSFNSSLPNNTDGTLGFKPAFGNICYDKDNDQFFVSNFEDGKIYRLDNSGSSLGSPFDYGVADSGSPGLAPIGERIWGVGYNPVEKRLYYAVWSKDGENKTTAQPNMIRSIAINTGGTFNTGSDQHEFNLPNLYGNFSMPVADIAFSQDGQTMLLAERTINGNTFSWTAHQSRVLEYTGSSSSWAASPITKFKVGIGSGSNASGGIDFGYNDRQVSKCDSTVWMTGDALHLTTNDNLYGLQGTPSTGGDITNSVLIDVDEDLMSQDKTQIGDVEVFKRCNTNPCEEVNVIAMPSADNPQDSCCFYFTLQNNLPNYFKEVQIEAVSNVDIWAISTSTGWNVSTFSTQLVGIKPSSGGSIPTGTHQNVVKICLSNYNSTPQVVKVKWLVPNPAVPGGCAVACEQVFDFDCAPPPPKPKCVAVVNDTIYCDDKGQIFYDFDIQNNTNLGNPFTIGQINVNLATPAPPLNTVTPNVFPVIPNLTPGNSTTGQYFNLQLAGPGVIGGTQFCFTITAHDNAQQPMNCCTDTLQHCITIPVCDDCCDDFFEEVLESDIQCDLSSAPSVTFTPPVFSLSPTWVEWDFECDGTIDFVDNLYSGATPTHNYGSAGNYVACLHAYRIHGEDTCHVKQTKFVKVGEKDCCDDPNFANEVNKGFTITGKGKNKTFTPNGNFGECDQIEWLWGDGSANGFSTGTNSITHVFPKRGTYFVCMLVRRIRPDGTVCEEREYCQEVKIPFIIIDDTCCDDVGIFTEDVAAGFVVEMSAINENIVHFTPLQLDECDLVVWTLSGTANQLSVASEANETIEVEGLAAGPVRVAMLVTRGGECIQEYVEVINIEGEKCECGTLQEEVLQGFEVEEIDGTTRRFTPKAVCFDNHSKLEIRWNWNDESPIQVMQHNRAVTHQFPDSQNPQTYQVCMEVIREGIDGDSCESVEYCDLVIVSIGKVKKEQINIFPNPTTGTLTIELPTNLYTNSLQLQLSDLQGKTVLQRKIEGKRTQSEQISLDVHDLPNGIYLLNLFDIQGNGYYYQKVIKQ